MTNTERKPAHSGAIDVDTLDSVLGVVASVALRVCPLAQVAGRIKTRESRAAKMLRTQGAYPQDSVGARVIVRDVADCYEVIRRLHGRFQHVSEAYDDYIA